MQPQVLADGVQEPFERQDWHPESRTAQGRAARGGLPGQHRSAVDTHTEIHAQGRHAEVRRLRVRHTAPEHRVQSVRVERPAPQRQHQTESRRMAQVRVRVLTTPFAQCSIVNSIMIEGIFFSGKSIFVIIIILCFVPSSTVNFCVMLLRVHNRSVDFV